MIEIGCFEARAASRQIAWPEGETAPDIYRKHVARIEELEKENKRIAKEAADAEKRWQKAEEELADLREDDDEGVGKGGSDGQVEKLVCYLFSFLSIPYKF